jgi:Phosphotransferase enzyme family
MEQRLAISATPAEQSSNDALLRSLADQLPFGEYIRTAQTLCANHAFWHPLLPAELHQDSTVLVLETRLGALSLCLAARFSKVIAWHRSAEAAQRSERLFAEHGASNVTINVATEFAQLTLAPHSLTAIVVVGPDQDATGQWSSASQPLTQSVMAAAPSLLERDGVLILHDNNAWAYRHDASEMRGATLREPLPSVKRRLKRAFSATQTLVSRASLTAPHVPCPDYVPQDARLIDVLTPKNRYAQVKGTILNLRPTRQLWPSYLMLGTNSLRATLVEEILRAQRQTAGLQWLNNAKPQIKRVIAGNAGTSIVICGPHNDDTSEDVILRLPSTPRGLSLCETNALALKTIQRTPFAGKAPLLLAEGEFNRAAFWIESRARGREAQYGSDNLHQLIGSACAALFAFHQSSSEYITVSGEIFDRLVSPFFDDVASTVGPRTRERLAAIQGKLRKTFVGAKASVGITHGDFKLGNMLFSEENTLQSLIDWDGFQQQGFQIFDYLTHLLYTLSSESDAYLVQLYLDHILPWNIPPQHAAAVNGPVAALAPDNDYFQTLRIIFWFYQVSTRFDRLYKFHVDGQELFMNPALSAFESMLGIVRMEPVARVSA